MDRPHLIIVGGGLAGLSAGCYALRGGFRVTVVEHNRALGGVCTAWRRGQYTIDGCIHWLTGGPFTSIYEELEILPTVELQVMERFLRYRDLSNPEWDLSVTRDLDELIQKLKALCPEDHGELERIRAAARTVVDLTPSLDALELVSLPRRLHSFWDQRHSIGPLLHFGKALGEYADTKLQSPKLRRFLTSIFPETGPTFMLLWVLGYLERGYLSLPVGATGAFRDALIATFRRLGGEAWTHATVDEVLVSHHQAYGIRLSDGRELIGDAVISTSSAPETVLRLLGGRYDAEAVHQRLKTWRLFDPIVMVTFGVELPLVDQRGNTLLEGIVPLDVGGVTNTKVNVRVMNGDSAVAPQGHSTMQTMLLTSYEHWAQAGMRYEDEKKDVVEQLLNRLEPHYPGLRAAVRMVDVVTPLTYWNQARSWRGAYEGWMPSNQSVTGHVSKSLAGLRRFYMAGQWVEPGGGVPTAVLSGRQAVELLCHELGRHFVARHGEQ